MNENLLQSQHSTGPDEDSSVFCAQPSASLHKQHVPQIDCCSVYVGVEQSLNDE